MRRGDLKRRCSVHVTKPCNKHPRLYLQQYATMVAMPVVPDGLPVHIGRPFCIVEKAQMLIQQQVQS